LNFFCKAQALDSRKSVFELPNLSIPVRLFPKEKLPMDVVGDVSGRIAIIVEDMIDDVDGFCRAAEVLKERGAYKIYVMATHGLLSSDAPRLIDNSCIDEVVVTNTVPHEVQKMQCHKIKTVDISLLVSEAMRRIHNQESMSYLFRDINPED
jgi:ribose-phosphate pyrophosphokinase